MNQNVDSRLTIVNKLKKIENIKEKIFKLSFLNKDAIFLSLLQEFQKEIETNLETENFDDFQSNYKYFYFFEFVSLTFNILAQIKAIVNIKSRLFFLSY